MLKEREILDALRQCITPDDRLVVVHSSLPHLVPPHGVGEHDFVEAFQALTDEGLTLAFPAFTFAFCRDGRFHYRDSLPETGILPRWALSLRGATRTPHPIYSFVVVGPLAGDVAAAKNSTTFGDDSSFAMFETLNARLLMLGCDWSACSQLHRYEEEARVPYRYYKQFSGTATYDGDVSEAASVSMFVRNLDIDPEIIAEPAIARLRQANALLNAPLWKGTVESADSVSFAAACRAVLAENPWALTQRQRPAKSRVPEAMRPGVSDMETTMFDYFAHHGFGTGADAHRLLDLDSYATMQLIVYLERTFAIDVQASDIVAAHFATVDSIARFIESKC